MGTSRRAANEVIEEADVVEGPAVAAAGAVTGAEGRGDGGGMAWRR